MKYIFLWLCILIVACQGKLTEEQKKELRDGMKASEIVKISPAEITEAAFAYGRKIAEDVKQLTDLQNPNIDELEDQYGVTIFALEQRDSLLLTIEQQLIEAYASAKSADLTDNIQKIGTDTLLYTTPIMSTQSDGSIQFDYALGIKMPLKMVIFSRNKD